jgi:hypothetical protein
LHCGGTAAILCVSRSVAGIRSETASGSIGSQSTPASGRHLPGYRSLLQDAFAVLQLLGQ